MLAALYPVTESSPRGVYRAGAGRAEVFLPGPQPLTAQTRANGEWLPKLCRKGETRPEHGN